MRYGDGIAHMYPQLPRCQELLQKHAAETLAALGDSEALPGVVYTFDVPHKFLNPETGEMLDAFYSFWEVTV